MYAGRDGNVYKNTDDPAGRSTTTAGWNSVNNGSQNKGTELQCRKQARHNPYRVMHKAAREAHRTEANTTNNVPGGGGGTEAVAPPEGGGPPAIEPVVISPGCYEAVKLQHKTHCIHIFRR